MLESPHLFLSLLPLVLKSAAAVGRPRVSEGEGEEKEGVDSVKLACYFFRKNIAEWTVPRVIFELQTARNIVPGGGGFLVRF